MNGCQKDASKKNVTLLFINTLIQCYSRKLKDSNTADSGIESRTGAYGATLQFSEMSNFMTHFLLYPAFI